MAEYSDTRDDVMAEPNLRQYLLDKTAEEFRARIDRRYPLPPLFTLAGSLALVILCWLLGQVGAMLVFLAILLLQGCWLAGAIWRRAALNIDENCEAIRAGIPPESVRQLVTNRLQWWAHLIVPTQWGPNSRLLSHGQRVEAHLTELESEYQKNQLTESQAKAKAATSARLLPAVQSEPEPEPDAQPLPEIDVEAILPELDTLGQRIAYEAKLNETLELQERLVLECGLYQAIHARVQSMVAKLKMIERLGDSLRQIGSDDLGEYVNQATDFLHERRRLVDQVDMIGPDEFLALVAIHKFQDPEPIPKAE